jgi:hypothetical protein
MNTSLAIKLIYWRNKCIVSELIFTQSKMIFYLVTYAEHFTATKNVANKSSRSRHVSVHNIQKSTTNLKGFTSQFGNHWHKLQRKTW